MGREKREGNREEEEARYGSILFPESGGTVSCKVGDRFPGITQFFEPFITVIGL